MHSLRKWISNILEGRDFQEQIQTPPRLALTGWSAQTRLYPGISKLTSSDKIPLSKKVSGRHQISHLFPQSKDKEGII